MNNILVPISKGKRTIFIYAVMLLYAGFAASSYGVSVVMPRKLTAMNAMEFYALASAMSTLGMMLALPLVGKLSDMFGGKVIAIFGVTLQLITRIGMMAAPNAMVFMVLNLISNIGLGFFVSAPFSMIADVVSAEERPKFYGMLTTFKALGSLIGPLITGQMIDSGYLNLALGAYFPFMLISIPFILILYPNRKTSRTAGTKFDFAGIFLMIIGISCIIFWLSLAGKYFAWISPISIIMLLVGILCIFILVRVENKHSNPSVAINMFKKKRFTIAFLCAMLVSAFSTTLSAYVIVYTQQVMKLSSVVSSTVTMPMTIAQAVFGVLIGRYIGKKFVERFRPMALLSLSLLVIGMLALCTLSPTSSMFIIYFASTLGGIGTIVPQSTFPNFFQTELKPQEIGAAQGMFSFGATGGSSIFMAATGAVLNAGGTLNHTFIIAAACLIVALGIGFIGFKLSYEKAVSSAS